MSALRYWCSLALAAIVFAAGSSSVRNAVWAQVASESAIAVESARVEFDHPGGGTPAVELDLPAGLFRDVVGLGDAAIAGVAEGLQTAPVNDEATQADVKLATDQLAAIRTIVGSVQGALGEVRVRVYADSEGIDVGSLVSHYDAKLNESAWTKIVHARDDEKFATVFLMRDNGAVRGVFVIVTEGRELVLVNVLCDISPERIKQITKQATSIGLELGGEDALREIVGKIRGRRSHAAVTAPVATVSDSAHIHE
jgi:hypothetical protein